MAIAGSGRMGSALAETIQASPDLALAGVWQRGGNLGELLTRADVLIDFSLAEATASILDALNEHPVPLVCGVSAISEDDIARMRDRSATTAVVYDRNMSVGVAVLNALSRQAAASLGEQFDVSIHETHHVHKQDAPSGTALKLGEAVAEARNTGLDSIHFESERIGEVPGEHQVIFASDTESLVLEHSVTTRQVFVDGAIRAARWVVNREAGFYSMHDVLFSS